MKVTIITPTQVKRIIEDELMKKLIPIYKETEKMRERILDLEMRKKS